MSTVAMPVSVLQRQRLARIDAEDFSGVVRKTREDLAKLGVTLSEEEAEEGILALKQYYAVALLDPKNEHAVSDVIDPFWHAHILHTKQYVEFCQEVFGEYIHHQPLDHADHRQVQRVVTLYRYTAGIYKRMFSYVSPAFYPEDMPSVRMVCLHQEVANPELRREAIIERVLAA